LCPNSTTQLGDFCSNFIITLSMQILIIHY
jgi:hypothetical protein